MKTESRLPVVYLYFIRKHDIPLELRRDNAKSKRIHRVGKIHIDLVIADQWIEIHCSWKNPSELNGVSLIR
jgi:hypothetical protein